MSFLDSILGEISGGKAQTQRPASPVVRLRDTRPDSKNEISGRAELSDKSDALSQSRRQPVNGSGDGISSVKRKAPDELGEGRQKLVKKENWSEDASGSKSASTTPPAMAQPYRGTAGLDRSKLQIKPAKPPPQPRNPAIASAAPVIKPTPRPSALLSTTTTSATQSAPKKGSYAEMMARAKASNKTYTGIKHKATEKTKPAKPDKSEKAVKAEKEDKSKRAAPEKDKKRALTTTQAVSGSEGEKVADKKRKQVELAYKGTMRPAPGALGQRGKESTKQSGSSRNTSTDGRKNLGADRQRNHKSKGYDSDEDEDEDGEEGEERYDDESDLSDMEADLWEVDEEETRAARIAKQEDKNEQQVEAQLQREKKAKKEAMLKRMQADAIARSDRRRQLG